jgi:hypothetical protein
VQPIAPLPPAPASLMADAAGAFSGSLSLAPGTWDVVVTPSAAPPITRRVTVVPADGLSGSIDLEGGESYLEVDQDGTPIAGVSGGISNDGKHIDLAATTMIRILAGNAGAVRLLINGVGIGFMGADGAVVEWQIARTGD